MHSLCRCSFKEDKAEKENLILRFVNPTFINTEMYVPYSMNDANLLESIARELEEGKKCILLHVNADPDALGSAAALALAFSEITIGTCGGLSKNGKNLQKNLAIEVVDNPDISTFDKVIVLDTPSPNRLGQYENQLENPIVIDHHTKSFEWDTELCYIDENMASCGEIIYKILKLGKREINRKIGLALLAGILTDTGKFSYANSNTLITFGEIMDSSGVDMEDVLTIFEEEHETDYSKRISRLKGAQRLRFEKVGGYIIAVSQIGSFEASVCNSLIFLGADVAFVGSQREEKFRISARAIQNALSEGLHLGNLLVDIGKENGCEGGGHNGAAGLTGSGDVEAMLNICMHRVKACFSGKTRG
jgi:nanoRNase/pAp phosphatase (c-di-AMP/oligoRNAs hydrolase)